ncbi:enolase C-terminal domain-like protein [Paraburkholderia oxyphila]|uniref:enolase C-terminal domain-like protein n=1 Tax=Paraburkholderia oxyphila TaxID=614212 RepID=UPI00048263A6|nr:enolase C-terminal domain-like protein [Paraburkholderia oxyphila]
MKIARVRVTPVAVCNPPLLNSGGLHSPYTVRSIIEVEADNGLVGLGETFADRMVLDRLNSVQESLVGLSPFDVNALRRITQSGTPPSGAEAFRFMPGSWNGNPTDAKIFGAFEAAFLDLQARCLGIPLCELLGGAVRQQVPFSAYLFFKYSAQYVRNVDPEYAEYDPWGEVLTVDQLVGEAQRMIDLYGFRSIKVKAGVLTPQEDVACIKALRKRFPAHPIRLDTNAAWSQDTARRMAELLDGDLEYYEDPTPGLGGMADLHLATGLPMATNMVVTDFDEFRRNLTVNGVQVILGDHHYWGGLRATQQLASMCEMFDIELSMHSNCHLGISLMTMTHVAAAIPNLTYACDTHYPWFTEDLLQGGRVPIRDGSVAVRNLPGIGVDLDHKALAEMHQRYLRCGLSGRDDAAQMRKFKPDWERKKPRF